MLKEKGIQFQKTVPYIPEQNGKAEREMRTIVESARTMLEAKDLEKKFWAEAINTATYTINRTGPSKVENKTPYEVWNNKSTDIKYFQIFGSEAYVHIPKEKRKKWDAKSKKGIFVGYEQNTKGYRIYFPESNKIEIARDVKFLESQEKEMERTEMEKQSSKDNHQPYVRNFEDSSEEDEPINEDENVEENQEENARLRNRREIKRLKDSMILKLVSS